MCLDTNNISPWAFSPGECTGSELGRCESTVAISGSFTPITTRIIDKLNRQDKGGNVAGSYSGGIVTAWLTEVPGSGSLLPSQWVSETLW